MAKRQIKFDSIEKWWSYRFFNMTAYRFLALKMFELQHQFNNIADTIQTTRCQNSIVTVNVRNVYRQLQAPTETFGCLIWEVFQCLVDRSLW